MASWLCDGQLTHLVQIVSVVPHSHTPPCYVRAWIQHAFEHPPVKTVFLLIFAVAVALAAPPPKAEQKRLKALIEETIPNLTLKDASFEEAIAEIQRAWKKSHPDDPLPIAITDWTKKEKEYIAYPQCITLELHDVPYLTAFHYIASASHTDFSLRHGLPTFDKRGWGAEDWGIKDYKVPPGALAALGLRAKSKPEEVRQALNKFGIELEGWMNPRLFDSGKTLVVKCLPEQHDQIAGVLLLLQKGFKITK